MGTIRTRGSGLGGRLVGGPAWIGLCLLIVSLGVVVPRLWPAPMLPQAKWPSIPAEVQHSVFRALLAHERAAYAPNAFPAGSERAYRRDDGFHSGELGVIDAVARQHALTRSDVLLILGEGTRAGWAQMFSLPPPRATHAPLSFDP